MPLKISSMLIESPLPLISALLPVVLLLILTVSPYAAANDQGEGQNALDPQGAGDVALVLLALGFFYVGLRWFAKPVRGFFSSLGLPRKTYGLTLKHSLALHTLVMVPATIAAAYHGLVFWRGRWNIHEVSGLLVLGVMVFLSAVGILLRLHLLKDRYALKVRKAVRLLHNQWLITILLIISLAIHLLGGD